MSGQHVGFRTVVLALAIIAASSAPLSGAGQEFDPRQCPDGYRAIIDQKTAPRSDRRIASEVTLSLSVSTASDVLPISATERHPRFCWKRDSASGRPEFNLPFDCIFYVGKAIAQAATHTWFQDFRIRPDETDEERERQLELPESPDGPDRHAPRRRVYRERTYQVTARNGDVNRARTFALILCVK